MPPFGEAGPSRATSHAASHDSTASSFTSSFRKPSSGNRLVVEVETRSNTPTSSKSSTGSSSSAGRAAPAGPANAASAYVSRNAQRDDSSSSSAKRPSSLKSYFISAASTSSPKSPAPAAVTKRQTSDLAVIVASPPRRDSHNSPLPPASGIISSASPIKPNAARIGAPSSSSLRNPTRGNHGQFTSRPASASSEGNNDTQATSKFQQARLRQAGSSSPSPAAAAGRHKPLVIEKKQPAGLSRHLLPPKPRSSLLSPVTPTARKASKPQPAKSLLEEAKARAAKRQEYTKARTAGRTSADYVPPPAAELPRSEFGAEARIWGSPFREPRAGNSGHHRGTRLLRCQWDVDRSTHFEHNHVQCGKTFSTAEALIRHVCRAHIDLVPLPPGEVKMSCQWKGCANRRFDKTTLKRQHLCGHLAAAAFECPFKECRLSNGVELTDYKAQDQHIRLEHQDFRDDSELRPLLWVVHLPGSAALEQHKKKLRAIAACIKNLPSPTPWWKAEIAIPLSSEPASKPAPKVDDTLQSLSMETGNVKTLATQASAVLPATQVDESSEPPGPRPWNRLIPQLARVEPPAIRLPLDLPGSVKLEAVEIDVAPKAKRLIYHDWHPRRQILDFVDLGGDASLNEDDLRDLQSSIRSPPARASGPAVDEGHRAWATKAEIIEFRNAVAAGRNPDTASLNIRPHARNALNMTMGKATESGSETEESPSASIQPKPAAAAASVRQRRGPVLPAPPSGITSRQSRKRRWQAEEQDREEVARSPPTTNVSNSEHEKESQAAAKESSQSVIVIPSSDHDAAPGLSAVERPSTADVPARHAAEPSATAAMEHVTLRVPDAHPGAQPVIDQASGQASLADSKGRQRQRSATFELNAADGVPSHAHLSAAVTNGSTLLPEQPRETSAASHAPSISTSAPVNTTREGSVASLASSAPAPLLPLKRSAPSPLPSDAVFIEFSDSSEDEYDRDGRPVMPLAPQRLPSQSNGRLTQASRLSSSELHAKPLAVAGSKEAPFSLDDDASNSSSSTLLASPLHLFKRPRTSADQPSRTGQPTPRPHVSSFIGHSGTISDSALDAEKPASQPRPSAPPTGGRHALGQGRREPRQYMPNPIEVLQQAQRAKES